MNFLPFWGNPARGADPHCPIAVFTDKIIAVAQHLTAIRHPMLVVKIPKFGKIAVIF